MYRVIYSAKIMKSEGTSHFDCRWRVETMLSFRGFRPSRTRPVKRRRRRRRRDGAYYFARGVSDSDVAEA